MAPKKKLIKDTKREVRQHRDSAIRDRIVSIVMILFSVYLLLQVGRSLVTTRDKLAILDTAQEDVTELRVKNIQKLMESEEVLTDRFVEKQVRDKLFYSKDGERVFVIPEELIESEELDAYMESIEQ